MLSLARLVLTAAILIIVGAFINADDISQYLREASAREFCGTNGWALVHVDDSERYAQQRAQGTRLGSPLCSINHPELGDGPAPSSWVGRFYGAPLLAVARLIL